MTTRHSQTRRPSANEQRKMMDDAMKQIAQIHADIDYAPWLVHQIYRFLFEGYPHHAGPLFSKLNKLRGGSQMVRGLRLVLKSEAKRPTPFSGLIPKGQLFKDHPDD